MKVDAQLGTTDLHDVAGQAQRYERMGFEAIWTQENMHDPYLPLTIAAQATTRIGLGTDIAIAFARSPFSTAITAWDLQHLSRGRFKLGLGTQVRAHVERRFSMPFDHPAGRLKDYVRCIRAIWDSFQNNTPASYEGEFYQFKLITPAFNPGPLQDPAIPILLAGINPEICRAIGEVADGFHLHPFHSAEFIKHVVRANLDAGARKSGKTVQDLEIAGPIFTVSADSQAETDRQLETIRRKVSFYASTPNYRGVLSYHGLEALGIELSQLARQRDWDAMPARIPDSLLDLMVLVAPPAELGKKLKSRYEGLVDRVSPYYAIDSNESEERWKGFVDGFRAA